MSNAVSLTAHFQTVELPEITGIDFATLSHTDVARLLPAYGG